MIDTKKITTRWMWLFSLSLGIVVMGLVYVRSPIFAETKICNPKVDFGCPINEPFIDPNGVATPATFTVRNVSACANNLSFSHDITNEDTYNPTTIYLYRDGVLIYAYPTNGSNTGSYTDTGITPGSTHSYSARGLRAYFGSTPQTSASIKNATPASITTPTISAPGPTTGLSASVSGGSAQILFNSNLSQPYGGYTLPRNGMVIFSAPAIPMSGTQFIYGDNGFNPSAANVYTVQTFNSGAGCSVAQRALSSVVSITVPAIPPGVSVVGATGGTASVTWSPSAGASYYDVQRMTTGAWGTVSSPSGTTFNDSGLAYGTNYFYRVRACSTAGGNVGCSDFSPTRTVNISAPIPAPSISSISPMSGSVNGGETVQIFGSNFQSGATVAFRLVGDFGVRRYGTVLSVSGTSISFRTPALNAGVSDVWVTNPDGQAAFRAGWYTYIDVPPPPPPACTAWGYNGTWGTCQIDGSKYQTLISSSPVGCVGADPNPPRLSCTENMSLTASPIYLSRTIGDIYLTWRNIHAGMGYEIERATVSGGPFTRVATISSSMSATTMTRTLKDEPAPNIYYYRIKTPSAGNMVSEEVVVNLRPKVILSESIWGNAGISGVGWISLSCESDKVGCGTNRYNIFIDSNNYVSGVGSATVVNQHGYSWLSFNKADLVGCPSGACVAQLDTSVVPNKIKGWARFIGATGENGSLWSGWVSLNSEPAVGGTPSTNVASVEWKPFSVARIWNAFVSTGDFWSVRGWKEKMRNTFSEAGSISRAYAQSGVSYGVTYDPATSRIAGTAWGGNVTGWIDFNAVVTPQPPSITNVVVSEGTILDPNRSGTGRCWCDENPYYAVRWDYYSPSNSGQGGATITFDWGTGSYTTSTTSSAPRFNLVNPLSYIPANATFSVVVKVRDTNGLESVEMRSGNTLIVPSHVYPFVTFNWTPKPARTGWPINFSGTSTVDRSGGAFPSSGWSWSWTFSNATSTSGVNTPNATAVFNADTATSNDRVTLTVTDGTRSCSLSQQVLDTTGVQPKKIRGIQEK